MIYCFVVSRSMPTGSWLQTGSYTRTTTMTNIIKKCASLPIMTCVWRWGCGRSCIRRDWWISSCAIEHKRRIAGLCIRWGFFLPERGWKSAVWKPGHSLVHGIWQFCFENEDHRLFSLFTGTVQRIYKGVSSVTYFELLHHSERT